jgi:hypothetical protein
MSQKMRRFIVKDDPAAYFRAEKDIELGLVAMKGSLFVGLVQVLRHEKYHSYYTLVAPNRLYTESPYDAFDYYPLFRSFFLLHEACTNEGMTFYKI